LSASSRNLEKSLTAAKQPLSNLMLRSARSARLEAWAAIEIVAILRDASLRDAPQDEVEMCGKADNARGERR
jgi:hypothetical protein